MARRLKIGVDMDGVIVDFVGAFNKEAGNVLGREIFKRPARWDFEDVLTPEEFSKVMQHIRSVENWFYLNALSLGEAPELLPWLCTEHDVYFITTRMQTKGLPVSQQTAMYLNEIGIQFPTVIVTGNKGPISEALALDAFIDDKVENLAEIAFSTKGKTKLYLMDQLHNAAHPCFPTWTRVNDFREFITYIEALSNE